MAFFSPWAENSSRLRKPSPSLSFFLKVFLGLLRIFLPAGPARNSSRLILPSAFVSSFLKTSAGSRFGLAGSPAAGAAGAAGAVVAGLPSPARGGRRFVVGQGQSRADREEGEDGGNGFHDVTLVTCCFILVILSRLIWSCGRSWECLNVTFRRELLREIQILSISAEIPLATAPCTSPRSKSQTRMAIT